jgi:hypothetical protein
MGEREKRELLEEIEKLKELLRDREAALPVHSVRPHQLVAIEELEEEIEARERQLEETERGLPPKPAPTAGVSPER